MPAANGAPETMMGVALQEWGPRNENKHRHGQLREVLACYFEIFQT